MHSVSLQKLQMLTSVHNNAGNAYKADEADDSNRVIGIALLKAFSCAKNRVLQLIVIVHLLPGTITLSRSILTFSDRIFI